MKHQLLHSRLLELLCYEPETGRFFWRMGRRRTLRAGNLNRPKGRRMIRLDGRCHKEHRLAIFYMTGQWPVGFVDHINGDEGDNRWANLREATPTESCRNRAKAYHKTLPKGVYFRRSRGKFIAKLRIASKEVWLGSFPNPDLAAQAYDAAALTYFGAFARPNFPRPA